MGKEIASWQVNMFVASLINSQYGQNMRWQFWARWLAKNEVDHLAHHSREEMILSEVCLSVTCSQPVVVVPVVAARQQPDSWATHADPRLHQTGINNDGQTTCIT